MGSRKRNRSDAVAATEQQPEEPGLLQRIRNCWQFASLMQYIAMFGKVMKIDEDFEVEVCPLAARHGCMEVAHYGALMSSMDSLMACSVLAGSRLTILFSERRI